jgi:hypothetical protein
MADKQVLARFVTKLPPELRVPASEVVRSFFFLLSMPRARSFPGLRARARNRTTTREGAMNGLRLSD